VIKEAQKPCQAHYHHRSSFGFGLQKNSSPGLLLALGAACACSLNQLLAFHTYQNSLTSLVKLLLALFSSPSLPRFSRR
jgi:hypothetical protein